MSSAFGSISPPPLIEDPMPKLAPPASYGAGPITSLLYKYIDPRHAEAWFTPSWFRDLAAELPGHGAEAEPLFEVASVTSSASPVHSLLGTKLSLDRHLRTFASRWTDGQLITRAAAAMPCGIESRRATEGRPQKH